MATIDELLIELKAAQVAEAEARNAAWEAHRNHHNTEKPWLRLVWDAMPDETKWEFYLLNHDSIRYHSGLKDKVAGIAAQCADANPAEFAAYSRKSETEKAAAEAGAKTLEIRDRIERIEAAAMKLDSDPKVLAERLVKAGYDDTNKMWLLMNEMKAVADEKKRNA